MYVSNGKKRVLQFVRRIRVSSDNIGFITSSRDYRVQTICVFPTCTHVQLNYYLSHDLSVLRFPPTHVLSLNALNRRSTGLLSRVSSTISALIIYSIFVSSNHSARPFRGVFTLSCSHPVHNTDG